MSVSRYEKLRLENIERNQNFLKNLGIDTAKPEVIAIKSVRPKRKIEEEISYVDVRRSSRVANLTIAATYKEENDEKNSSIIEPDELYVKEKIIRRTSTPGVRPPPSSDSSRALNAQLEVFFGTDSSITAGSSSSSSSRSSINIKSRLGEPIDDYGKAAIMALSNNGTQPKFSKYAGFCEWQNCVYLWVNIMKGKGINYGNTFNEKGRFITWFGGSKMTQDTDVVKRLLAAPSEITLNQLKNEGNTQYKIEDNLEDDMKNVIQTNTSKNDKNKIILFVRIEGENYSCLGQVAYISYDLKTQPIEFEWELLDFEKIKNMETFRRILHT